MKTFKEFCSDAHLNEDWWNPLKQEKPKIIQPPQPKPVLAYKNYQPGVLNKGTGVFTPRPHSGVEQQRYGWKPVKVSSYSKADTPGPLTASGERFSDTARGVAVPYRSLTDNRPSIPFGTRLQMTTAPGTNAPIAKTKSFDTGNFGPTGEYNRKVRFDLSRQTAADVTGNPNITSSEFGKRMVYVRNEPVPKPKPKFIPKTKVVAKLGK